MVGLSAEVSASSANNDERSPLEDAPAFGDRVAMSDQEKPKSIEEIAAERNYHLGPDGSWRDEDGIRVPGFGLEIDYPDLARRVEDFASKYSTKIDDYGGIKLSILRNAEELQKASDDRIESILALRAFIGTPRSGDTVDERLVNYSESDLQVLSEMIASLNRQTKDAQGNKDVTNNVINNSERLIRCYYPGLNEGNFIDKLAEYSMRTDVPGLSNAIAHGLDGFRLNLSNGELFGDYLDYFAQLSQKNEMIGKWDNTADIFRAYVLGHGMKADTVAGFEEYIIPMLQDNEDNLASIAVARNSFGWGGTYGICDYQIECHLSHFDSRSIDHLVRIRHEMPASDYQKFEQNRIDALRIQGLVIGGRDFIHDERPGTHAVLSAILDYYDHRDDESADSYRAKVEQLEQQYHFGVLPNALNLEAFEQSPQKVDKMRSSDDFVNTVGGGDERAVDVLRRLVENTAPVPLEAPQTKFKELNDALSDIHPIISMTSGEVRIDISEVGPAITSINSILLENLGKQNIDPSLIDAISYLDKMSGYALQQCDKHELSELPFDPMFKEIVRFSQLTSSAGYSERDFETRYQSILSRSGEAYGDDDVDTKLIQEAYRTLHQWIVGNTTDLAREYRKKPTTERFAGAVWSGNLSDSLISLFERI